MTIKNGIFIVLWAAIITTGIFLGTWQIHRLSWKQEWLARIDRAYQQGPEKFIADLPCTNVDRTVFYRLKGKVHFDETKSFIIRPRVTDGMFGGHLFQLGQLATGQKIWINRGFIPETSHVLPVTGTQNVTLQIRATDINPAAVLKQNPKLMMTDLKIDGCDALAAIGVVEQTNVKSAWPLTVGERPNPPNDHFYYACFWFTMSGVAFLFGLIAAWNTYKKRSV